MVGAVRGTRSMPHEEHHRIHRTGWLRAAVLGANDGVVSTSSLLLGVAAAHAPHGAIVVAGVAGMVAGAMAMAAGEYVSVSSQADIERSDLAMEREGLESDEAAEREELASIYVDRGLTPDLAREVARQLMAHDALGAHARDELGIQRGTPCASFASSRGVGDQLRRRRHGAGPDSGHHPGGGLGTCRCRRFFCHPCAFGRYGRAFWRCGAAGGGDPRSVLGRLGHGTDRGRRCALRRRRVKARSVSGIQNGVPFAIHRDRAAKPPRDPALPSPAASREPLPRGTASC